MWAKTWGFFSRRKISTSCTSLRAKPKRKGAIHISRKLAAPYFFWLTVFVIAPLIIVVVFAFTGENGGVTLDNFKSMWEFRPVFAASFRLAFYATAICLLISYPIAYVVSRETPQVQSVFMVLLMVPMWINFLLRTYAWMSILENNGLLNKLLVLLGIGKVSIINTEAAVALGMVYNYLPFMLLPILTVLQKLDRSLLEASSDLGANGVRTFLRVVFPLSLPGVLSGVTMVFVPSVSTFVISKLLGGGKTLLLGDLIEMQFLGNAYNPYIGSAVSIVMMLIVLVCMFVMNKFGDGGEETSMF
ncbi:MAG: ABC transporter permease [Oscillospiraceae bacterium]|jgi:spermidine/putrescine transport system permease protein|nr:ABC transporter permease [Oscillospiraceae bacterium]